MPGTVPTPAHDPVPDTTRGYTSGSMGADDTRPTYDPYSLLIAIQRLLADRGVVIEPDESRLYVAGIAAADLLRALGVRPEIAPTRRTR